MEPKCRIQTRLGLEGCPVVGDRERVRVRNVDARQVRVVRAPVDDAPGTFDLEASVRYYREDFVFEGYAQKFAVFAEEAWRRIHRCRHKLVTMASSGNLMK
jgi:hypothetical protein